MSYLCNSLKSLQRYIAFFLFGLLVITIMPFNAFHTHAVDMHVEARLKQDAQHHCELDLAFCDDMHAATCGHTQHISSPTPSCFTCSFPFINTFTFAPSQQVAPVHCISYLSVIAVCRSIHQVSQTWMNKGPPTIQA